MSDFCANLRVFRSFNEKCKIEQNQGRKRPPTGDDGTNLDFRKMGGSYGLSFASAAECDYESKGGFNVPLSQSLSSAALALVPLRNLKKTLLIGELLELVESLSAEHEFIEFLYARLIKFYFNRNRYSNDRPIKSNETNAELKERFAQAINMLNFLLMEDCGMECVVEDCLLKFKAQRFMILLKSIEQRDSFLKAITMLAYYEPDKNVSLLIHDELKVFCEIFDQLYNLKYDIQYKKLTRKTFNKKLDLIKLITRRLGNFEAKKMSSSSLFAIKRAKDIATLRCYINRNLNRILDDMAILKEHIVNNMLVERDRLSGHFMHVEIVEATIMNRVEDKCDKIKEATNLSAVLPTTSGHVCTVQLTPDDRQDVRDGFLKFYRSYARPMRQHKHCPRAVKK